MKTVLVIGGGVTGLSAMYELQKWKKENDSDTRLILVEAAEELGGKIRTVKEDGFIMESGADSMVVRKAERLSFIKDLQLEDEIVYNATGRSFLFTEGELKAIPADSVFGIPTSIESLAKSTLVSAEGKVEALKDFYTKNDKFTREDSVGDFLETFLGKELVEKQIAPVLSGVYSGDLHDLTISSTIPYVLDYKEQYGSIIKGMEANKDQFLKRKDKKFLSFKNGLGVLIEAYERTLKEVEIYKGWKAESIEKINDSYQVCFQNGEVFTVDEVVLSIPNTGAEKLLQMKEFVNDFDQLKTSSIISIYIGFNISDSVLPLEGTGFIKANGNQILCDACTWTSRKWKHTSANGNLLVRLFYKSSNPAFSRLKEMSEEELLQTALLDLKKSLGLTLDPVTSIVTNWDDSMPNYLVSHPQIIQSIENKLAEKYPGIWIAGCSYYGVGIPDCIENGADTAHRVIKHLSVEEVIL